MRKPTSALLRPLAMGGSLAACCGMRGQRTTRPQYWPDGKPGICVDLLQSRFPRRENIAAGRFLNVYRRAFGQNHAAEKIPVTGTAIMTAGHSGGHDSV